MKILSFVKLIACIVVCLGIMLLASCGGVTVAPDGDGGVVITPNENQGGNGGGNNTTPGTGNENNNGNLIHSHTYKLDTSSDSSYSCTEGGLRTWRCACGESFTETVEAPGHDIRSYEGKAATCTEDGWEPYEKCIRGECEYTTYQVIPSSGHQFTNLADIEATCTTNGYIDRMECSVCGYHSETVVAPLGHISSTVEGTQPTCTKDGYSSYDVCTRSGCAEPEIKTPTVIPALGHDNVTYEAKQPSCTDFGWNSYSICQRCSFSTYQQIDATGHTFDNGYCACGYSDLGLHEHIWSDGYVISAAKCIESGIMGYTCTDENCGDTKNEIIPAIGHDNETHPAKEATCTSEGWYAYEECQRCGYNTFARIPMRDHSYIGSITQQPTCTLSGVRTYKCSCGKAYDVDIEKLGHDWGNWYTTKDATCEASGQEQRVCMNNSAHVDIRTLSKHGHTWGEWIMISAATCDQQGQERRVCTSNSAHIELREIPTTEHIVDAATGICGQCGNQLSYRLDAPTISTVDVDTGVLHWNTVDGADHYEVSIEPGGDYGTTKQTYINLESYYGVNTQLKVKIRAMPMASSSLMSSSYCEYVYEIPGQPIVNSKGIGSAVNLLTGSYINFASGTTSIFNEALFNRLRVNEDLKKTQYYESIYKDNLYGYVKDLSTSIGEKVNMSASVGVDKVASITSGYTFEIKDTFTKKTQSQTKAAFYDLNYMYAYKGVEIYGYKDTEKLSNILSDEFKADAMKVQNNEMTPEEFIDKYGTHIVTAATYGATFNLHYEMISNDGTIQTSFGTNVEEGIKSQLSATLYGINIGTEVGTSTESDYNALSTYTKSNTYSKFIMRSSGGDATGNIATSLSEFAGAFESWSAGLDSSNDYVIIDVPDNSLYFVWDFLGDDYSEAKAKLHKYFYTCCDEQYYSVKEKISDMYQDSLTFDEETGTVTVNFSGLQNYTNLDGINYTRDGNVWFDSDTGVFTVYSKYNNVEVKKIVFEGAYYTEDGSGQLIENRFNNLSIKFNQWWSNDIVIEFKNFGYDAGDDKKALDFSAVSSKNITIIVNGYVGIYGGNGSTGNAGCIAIDAVNSDIALTGNGIINVKAGNGKTSNQQGANGSNGGSGLVCKKMNIDINGEINIIGGNGSDGQEGVNGTGNGGAGGKGGDGGHGGIPIICEDLILTNFVQCKLTCGNGGLGGRGGNGADGYIGVMKLIDGDWRDGSDGGDGGTGGNGGNSGFSSELIQLIQNTDVLINYGIGGNGGQGGNGGKGGDGGPDIGTYYVEAPYGLNAGDGGRGGRGGHGGWGGIAGKGALAGTSGLGGTGTYKVSGLFGTYHNQGEDGIKPSSFWYGYDGTTLCYEGVKTFSE